MCIAWRGREGHSGRGFAFIHTYTYDASLPSPPLPSHPSDPPQTTHKKYDPSPPIHPIPPPRNHQHQQYAQAYYRDAPEAGEDKELLWLGRYLVRACVDACVCGHVCVFGGDCPPCCLSAPTPCVRLLVHSPTHSTQRGNSSSNHQIETITTSTTAITTTTTALIPPK